MKLKYIIINNLREDGLKNVFEVYEANNTFFV